MEQYFKSKNFQPEHTDKCDLLIELNPTAVSYAIINPLQDEIHVLFDAHNPAKKNKIGVLEQLDALLKTKAELRFHFRKVKIYLTTFQYTFVPKQLFDPSTLQEYGKFMKVDGQKKCHMHMNELSSLGIKNIFSIDDTLYEALQYRFHQPSLFNQANPFISGISKNILIEGSFLVLNIQLEVLEVALFSSGKLICYNLFDCFHADEFNYFLLYILKEFNLDTRQTKIFLTGRIEVGDAYYQRVQKYFRDIQFLRSTQPLIRSNLAEQFMPHAFFSLMNLSLCE